MADEAVELIESALKPVRVLMDERDSYRTVASRQREKAEELYRWAFLYIDPARREHLDQLFSEFEALHRGAP